MAFISVLVDTNLTNYPDFIHFCSLPKIFKSLMLNGNIANSDVSSQYKLFNKILNWLVV